MYKLQRTSGRQRWYSKEEHFSGGNWILNTYLGHLFSPKCYLFLGGPTNGSIASQTVPNPRWEHVLLPFLEM